MKMDPRCKRLNELSAHSQQLYRQLAEGYLEEACRNQGLAEALCLGDYAFLAAVAESGDGCAIMAHVARQLGINPSTATRQVNRLVADGLVTKSAAPNDDRRYEIRLTPSGRALTTHMEDALFAAVQAAYANVTEDELNVVYRFMEKYNGGLEGLIRPQTPPADAP